MKTWTRALIAQGCGLCGHTITTGDPVLVIEIAGIRRRVRCAACAGPAPPDLPAMHMQSSTITPTPLVRFGAVRLPLEADGPPADWKTRQLAREPEE